MQSKRVNFAGKFPHPLRKTTTRQSALCIFNHAGVHHTADAVKQWQQCYTVRGDVIEGVRAWTCMHNGHCSPLSLGATNCFDIFYLVLTHGRAHKSANSKTIKNMWMWWRLCACAYICVGGCIVYMRLPGTIHTRWSYTPFWRFILCLEFDDRPPPIANNKVWQKIIYGFDKSHLCALCRPWVCFLYIIVIIHILYNSTWGTMVVGIEPQYHQTWSLRSTDW